MKRFVTYLYEYDRGSRGRNIGFVRTDIRDHSCRMELHIRGLDYRKGKVPIYLVVAESRPLGIPAGELLLTQGMGNATLSFPDLIIGESPYNIHQLQVLVIRLGNGNLLAASFVKEPAEGILNGSFALWEEDTAADAKPSSPEEKIPENNIPEDRIAEEELPEEKTSGVKESIVEKPREEKRVPVEAPPEVSYRRIELTDIRSLPRRNWYLSNNRFVVHGFFNYHYLILKTVKQPEGRKRYIGVPGIYEQPERMMALLFGFPEFELSEEAKRARPQPDNDLTGAFGYWMCPVAEG